MLGKNGLGTLYTTIYIAISKVDNYINEFEYKAKYMYKTWNINKSQSIMNALNIFNIKISNDWSNSYWKIE